MVYDRGLLFGSCTGEAFGWPAILFVAGAAIAALTWFLGRRFHLNLKALVWAFVAVAVIAAGIAGAVTGFSPLTARLDRQGDSLNVATCLGTTSRLESVPISEVSGQFIVSQSAKAPARPLLRLFSRERQLAEVWLEHPGLDLDAMAGIAPGAVAEYRRWRAR